MKENNINTNLYSILESSCKQMESQNKNNHNTNENMRLATTSAANPDSVNRRSNSQPKFSNFSVKSAPKEKISLFDRNDFIHYDRKFHNELHCVIIPPFSFNLSISNENFSNFDMKTTMFGLKSTQDILTDQRINTKIHQDLFIDISMNLIFPDAKERKEIEIEKSAIKIVKDDILSIIDSKEEIEEKDFKIPSCKSNASYYLRASTLMTSALSLKKKTSGTLNVSQSNLNGTQNINEEKNNLQKLKKVIDNSFQNVKKIEEGTQHPHKKNIYAKNVFNVLPFHQFEGEDFCQVIFPSDPIKEIDSLQDTSESNLPDKFLLKKEENQEIFEFYQKEKLPSKSTSISNEDNSIKNKIKTAELYSYEREYTINISNPCEVFNRYLIFMNKDEKSANFVPIDRKMFLKKYKKVINAPLSEIDEYGTYSQSNSNANQISQIIGKKRVRAVIVIADECERINKKNEIFKSHGVMKEFQRIKLEETDYTEVELIKENKMSQFDNNCQNPDHNTEEDADEPDNLFGNSEDEKEIE